LGTSPNRWHSPITSANQGEYSVFSGGIKRLLALSTGECQRGVGPGLMRRALHFRRMGPLDLFTRSLRTVLGQAERDVAEVSPLRETQDLERKLEDAVSAIHRAADAMERHVEVVETLATSVPALTSSVNALVGELNGLLAVLAPLSATERELSRVERFLGRRRRPDRPSDTPAAPDLADPATSE